MDSARPAGLLWHWMILCAFVFVLNPALTCLVPHLLISCLLSWLSFPCPLFSPSQWFAFPLLFKFSLPVRLCQIVPQSLLRYCPENLYTLPGEFVYSARSICILCPENLYTLPREFVCSALWFSVFFLCWNFALIFVRYIFWLLSLTFDVCHLFLNPQEKE